MNCRVYYECWQMQCCGDPFRIGDTIKWLVCEPVPLNNISIDIGKLDYIYEAHDHTAKLFNFTGVVTRIQGLYEKIELSMEKPIIVKRLYGRLVELDSVNGNEPDIGELEICGYVVELENCSVSELSLKK